MTQQEIIYFVYKKLITYAFKIIKEKIIQSCFKTFVGRIKFKFVLFLFYPTPLYVLSWSLEPVTGLGLSQITTPYITSCCSFAPISDTQRCCIPIHLFSPTLSRPSLFATSTSRFRFVDFTNWVGAIHTSASLRRCTIVYIVQLLVPSYAPFSSTAERFINLT